MSALDRRMTLRTYLVLLGVGAMLPFVIVSGILLLRVQQDNRTSVERTLITSAREQATALDAEMAATIRTLEALAVSSQLDTADLPGFEAAVRRAAATQRWLAVRLVSTSPAAVMFDTSERPGEPVGPVVDPESLAAVLRERTPVVAPLRRSPKGVHAFAIRVPVVRNGEVPWVLTAILTPATIADVITREPLPTSEWTRTVVDSAGTVIARTREPERFVGTPATTPFRDRTTATHEGFYKDTSLDAAEVYVAFSHSHLSGWTSAVVVPVAYMDGALRRSMETIIMVATLVLLLSGGLAYWLAGRITSDLGAATAAAEALAEGHTVSAPPSIVADVGRLGQALERSSTLLADRSRERDRNLHHAEAARAEAEEANRAKDQFLAMLGHELRNPLSPIVTALAVLKLRGGAWSREHDVIERQVGHMSRLVNDLLDVSRIARRALDLHREPLDLADVITRATDMASPRLEEHRHTLTIDVPAGLQVTGDAVRLAQVFGNLLSNAATYTPDGGQVAVRARRQGDEIVVTVSDTGRGIAPDVAPHIFDLFVQGPRTLDRREGGLGLGLAIARSLVEQHGGHIEASSEGVDCGATFTVSLPAAPGARPPAAATTTVWVRTERPARVLVVDDNADAAEMLAFFLGQHGHDVRKASDGPDALRQLDTFAADVVVLDIGLPVMDGYELARRIAETRRTPRPVLIAATGYGQVEDAERSRAAGIAHHLVKPVDGDELLRLIAESSDAAITSG
ncbi:MAG: ATP-binding protein [Vicinamibacterales bacterium]